MRKKVIAANWKMYKTPEQAREFFRDFLPLIQGNDRDKDRDEVVVCPNYLCLDAAIQSTQGSLVAIGAQNLHWEKEGAYTGEICTSMLLAIGVTHVIIGHSERRQYFGETDDTVNLKLKAALEAGLIPIVCVGELLAEREAGQTAAVLNRQVAGALAGIDPAIAGPLVIAYEPVWAIGTGKTATPEIAEDAHRIVRAQIAKSLTPELAESTRILYGGSVKPDNTASLSAQPNIDGALVGGASLEAESFSKIVANSAL